MNITFHSDGSYTLKRMTDITVHPNGSYTINHDTHLDPSGIDHKWIEHKGYDYLIYYHNKSEDVPNPYASMILGGRCRCGYLNKNICRGDALIFKSVDTHGVNCTWNDVEDLYRTLEWVSCAQHYSICGCIIL